VTIASGPPDTAVAALELMATKLGRHGPDLIYEVAVGFSPAKLKAANLLKDPEVRKLASPQLLFANELRETLPCARKELAGRAAAEGDERALAQLKPLLNTGCGFMSRGECYRCVTPADRKAIQDAINAIESRWGGRDPPKPPG
jgi:serine/threonine-protein kinase